MENKLLIWVLKDDRPGNYSQAINLAEILCQNPQMLGFELQYEVKEIDYRKIAKIPNFLHFGKLNTITKESKDNLIENTKTRPQIIISAGRKSALIALDLKKIYPDLILLQIMNPGVNYQKFDLVIMPNHDKAKGDNILKILGSVVYMNQEKIKDNCQEFSSVFNIKSPKIGLLLGGSSKHGKFTIEDAKNLRETCDKLCQKFKAKLFITGSRRSDDFLFDILNDKNSYLKFCFKWQKNLANPYLAILENCDYLIVTGDSISMCCEAINFQKPTFIYASENFCGKKHLKFHQYIFSNKYAFDVQETIDKIDPKNLNLISEDEKIIARFQNILLKKL